MKHTDGNEYTIGEVFDNTVEVISWNGDEKAWSEIVEWAVPDTQGDAIQRAIDKRRSKNSSQ